jgi:hypothetical protein
MVLDLVGCLEDLGLSWDKEIVRGHGGSYGSKSLAFLEFCLSWWHGVKWFLKWKLSLVLKISLNVV